ncbi:MAG: transglycosylase SLT domain-containing protein [Pseudomonadota bacterium]
MTSEPTIHKSQDSTAVPSIVIDKARVQQHVNDQKSKLFFSQVCILFYKICRKSLAHLLSILFASPLRMLFWLTISLAITLFIPTSKPLYIQDYPYTLRVVTPQNQRVFASLSPFGVGFEYDLVNLFASESGYTVQWLQEDKSATALDMLQNNKADLVVGFPDLHCDRHISASPTYMHGQSVEVQLRDEKIDQYKNLAEARKNDNSEGYARAKVNAQYMDDFYSGESIVTDATSWQLWQPFARDDTIAAPLDDTTSYRWYWNASNDKLSAQALQFWHDRTQISDTVLADLNEHYFNFIRIDIDPLELRNLQRVIKTRLPIYQKTIDSAAKRYHIDPLLLTAVIFQESHFDPDAISYTGVRGIMQLTQSTADLLGVDRLNPHQSIEGGARYLRLLWDGLADVGLDDDTDGDPDAIHNHGSQPKLLGLSDWNRWCFTLAAFNQGRGHLRDAIRLSKSLGGSGLTWYELKRVYPLMAKKEFYSKLRYGPCRGNEAVQFVDNIRWYYYILSGAAVLSELVD